MLNRLSPSILTSPRLTDPSTSQHVRIRLRGFDSLSKPLVILAWFHSGCPSTMPFMNEAEELFLKETTIPPSILSNSTCNLSPQQILNHPPYSDERDEGDL